MLGEKVVSMNWEQAKTEYITTPGMTYRKLAKKYNKSLSAIARRGSEEGWKEQQERNAIEVTTKAVEQALDERSEDIARMFRIARKVLDKAEIMVDSGTANTPSALKEVTMVLKNAKEVLMIQSEADDEEQRERIAKLRKEAQTDAEKTAPTIEIVGLPEGFDV